LYSSNDGVSYLSLVEACLKDLSQNGLADGKCYIATAKYCRCSVEENGMTHYIDESFLMAVVEMQKWILTYGNGEKKFPNWGISHQGDLSVMYWCGLALSGQWWQDNYGRIPMFFDVEGWAE
jgi:hypothetical protein